VVVLAVMTKMAIKAVAVAVAWSG